MHYLLLLFEFGELAIDEKHIRFDEAVNAGKAWIEYEPESRDYFVIASHGSPASVMESSQEGRAR